VRTYTWDAENRLISVSLPSQPNLSVAFTYDGLGRRRSATLTDTAATTFVWCGERLCQSQWLDLVRGYYAEGEFLSAVPLYYGVDQIGSVRRGFLRAGASASDFDPYGAALQPGLPAADFPFAGLFLEKNSGLYLATYRAYDPATGRWLSRDPIGEEGGINLYGYVGGEPIGGTDSLGLASTRSGVFSPLPAPPYPMPSPAADRAFCRLLGLCPPVPNCPMPPVGPPGPSIAQNAPPPNLAVPGADCSATIWVRRARRSG
jgi:RHS repeat-associated protein